MSAPMLAYTSSGWEVLSARESAEFLRQVEELERDEVGPVEAAPEPPALTREQLADHAIALGPQLIGAVHDADVDEIEDLTENLDRDQLLALVVVLAAAFDPDRPWLASLAWVQTQGPQPVDGCGSHTAFSRHRRNGEQVDWLCEMEERRYQRDRKRAQKLAQRAGAA